MFQLNQNFQLPFILIKLPSVLNKASLKVMNRRHTFTYLLRDFASRKKKKKKKGNDKGRNEA